MARRYTRDNRGRFASGGGGATARGGRLRTAAGNKRKTQAMKAAGAGGAGVMKGAVKRDPGAMARRQQKKKPNTSKAAFERRIAMTEEKPFMAKRTADNYKRELDASSYKGKSVKRQMQMAERQVNAMLNRSSASRLVRERARVFYQKAAQFQSEFSQRPRYSTQRDKYNGVPAVTSSRFSAWQGWGRSR